MCQGGREGRTDVGVVDLREEAYLRRRHRVLLGEEQLELELSVCKASGRAVSSQRARISRLGND